MLNSFPPKIDIEQLATRSAPDFFASIPSWLRTIVIRFIRKIVHLDEVEAILRRQYDYQGLDFIDRVFEELDFSFVCPSDDLMRIPSRGRLLCVSNHPLGGLDGLILLRVLGSIRQDIRIVASDVLLSIRNIERYLLPVATFGASTTRSQITEIGSALQREECVALFPPGEVSRLSFSGIRDREWHRGAVWLAQRYRADIVPMFIEGRNSLTFYLISLFADKLSPLLLPRELFLKRRKPVRLQVGETVPAASFSNLDPIAGTRLLRYRVESLAAA